MLKIYLLSFCSFLLLLSCSNEKSRPETSGNPLFPGWYADPEVAIFNDTYWIFPTYSAVFEEQVFLDAFSSPDLVNWQKHERIIDTTAVKWAEKAMWAPCVVEKAGKFYLFFAANDIQTPESRWWNPEIHQEGMIGGIGIGVADQPQGPYQDYLGKPLINEVYNGAQPIDQFVFHDQDKYYLIYGGWGHCNLALLNKDFTGLQPLTDSTLVKEITPEGYVEGPVMFKRNGWYYLMWSEGNWGDGSYRVEYGRARSVEGPFESEAVVLESDTSIATGAGHHSVLQIPNTDDWYMVYHRRPIPNEGRDHRVTSIDRMYFDENGKIMPVKMTFEGVEKREL
jgi:beta-xylosidase